MDRVLANSSEKVAAMVVALALDRFAALLAPPFVGTLPARRPKPKPSVPVFRSVLTTIGSYVPGPEHTWIEPWAKGVFLGP